MPDGATDPLEFLLFFVIAALVAAALSLAS